MLELSLMGILYQRENYGEYSMKQYFLEQDRMNIKHIFMVMKLLIYQPVLFCKGFLRAFR